MSHLTLSLRLLHAIIKSLTEAVSPQLHKHCTDHGINLAFSIFKVGHFLNVKDSMTQVLRSRVIYKFLCAGCNASYTCKTTRHFSTLVREHLVLDKASHVYKHIASSQACRESCSTECFTILDTDASGFQLLIKKAMYIKWEKPIVNQQVKHKPVTFHVA